MKLAIIILIIVAIIAWIITWIQEKNKIIALILTFLSVVSLILGCISFLTNYDPIITVKEFVLNKRNEHKQKSAQEQTIPLEVFIPEVSNDVAEQTNVEVEKPTQSNYYTKPIILNIGDTVHRNDENRIHIMWTPIIFQDIYWIKVKVDDPFINAETEFEYGCKDAWYDMDVSNYSYDTVMFVSIAIWDKENSQKVYGDPISFELY